MASPAGAAAAGAATAGAAAETTTARYCRKFVKGDGQVPALKQELVNAQKSYSKEMLQLVAAKKGDGNFPWPLGAIRTVERPAQYDAWDVDELHLKLTVTKIKKKQSQDSNNTEPVLVPRAELVKFEGVLPENLADTISAAIQQKWESLLRKRDATPRKNAKSWAIERVFDWVDTQFGKFLRLVPEVIESYLGTSLRGDSQRRYLIAAVTEVAAVVEEITEEEREARKQQAIQNFVASQTRKMEREIAAAREKELAGAARRAEIEASGETQYRQPSQKEIAEKLQAKREAKGSRLAKRAPKANKPMDPEEKAKMEKQRAKEREAAKEAKKKAKAEAAGV